jgi:hypothetical protein
LLEEVGLRQETELAFGAGDAPLLRIADAELGSGIAGGRGKVVSGEVTWMTRSRACR